MVGRREPWVGHGRMAPTKKACRWKVEAARWCRGERMGNYTNTNVTN